MAVTDAPLAVNVAAADPAATTTEDGTVKFALLLFRASVMPPEGAAALSLTVQVEVPGTAIDDGLHTKELTVGVDPTVIVPPLAVTEIDAAEGEEAIAFVRATLREPTPAAGVTETVATTPLEIAVVFRPEATHL